MDELIFDRFGCAADDAAHDFCRRSYFVRIPVKELHEVIFDGFEEFSGFDQTLEERSNSFSC